MIDIRCCKVVALLVPVLLVASLSAATVSEYHMDELSWSGATGEVLDSVGTNNGTAQNGAITTTGISGNGGLFDGADDYVELADDLAVLRGTGSMSIWIKTTQTGDDTMWRAPGITGIEEAGGGDDVFWGWIDASGHIGITYANEAATKSTTVINDDTWHHVVLTRDSSSGEVVVYVDGIEEDRKMRASGSVSTLRSFASLGRIEDTGGTPEYFEGSMDEVEIFDTILTLEEVEDLYFKSHTIVEPDVEYRMDECYWLNSSATPEDVKDSSANGFHATSSNSAAITINNVNPTVCNYGTFSVEPDMVASDYKNGGKTEEGLTVSFWIKADQKFQKWSTIISKTKKYRWDNGWGFVNRGDESIELTFFINKYNENITDTTITSAEGWVHIVGTYDKNVMRLYKNGVEVDTNNYNKNVKNAEDPMKLAFDGDSRDGEFIGSLDEVKFWDEALDAIEIKRIFILENSGKNYDGTPRTCPACETDITAGAWEFIGVPADFRTETNKDVADVFEEFVPGDYGDPNAASSWVLFKRTYSDTNNSSKYDIVPYTGEALEFGQGYWLKSRVVNSWSENGLQSVDYNSTDPACPTERCVEIDLKSVNLNFDPPDNDPNDGTGTDRNNMLGFPGKTPVEWADCRIVVDGTAYTPTDANASGFIDKQIWQYNPGAGGADANGYTTCDDSLTTCKLEPYKGFWLVLSGKTKNKTVKLLIPQE